jgi:mono/diheme cytochrome c family protein
MKSLRIAILTLLVTAAVAVGIPISGLLDVAATTRDPGPARWLLEQTRESSVERRAAGIAVPDLSDPGQVPAGAHAYSEMCAGCHGAPGHERFLGATYMNPEPPDLTRGPSDLSPAEMFWVIKHGIRMTGMPAWGPTHPNAQLWELVAFIRRLPALTSAAYGRLVEQGAASEAGHEHHHGSLGEASHEAYGS